MQKTLLVVLSFLIVASMLISCASGDENIISVGEPSTVSEESAETSKVIVSVENTDITYTESDFRIFYILQKENFISYNQYYESMGYQITDNGAAVGDTEEFWASGTGLTNDDGSSIDFAEYFFDYAVDVFEAFVAKKILAENSEITFDVDFYADLNTTIASDISANSLVDDDVDIIDADGNIPTWIMDRWEMDLASKGLDKETWIDFNYVVTKIDDYLMQKLKDSGKITAIDEETAKEEFAVLVDEEIKDYLANNIKIKYIAYGYRSEADYENEDESSEAESSSEVTEEITKETTEESTEESSEETTEETFEEVSGEELTPEEKAKKYNEELLVKCEAIFNTLKVDASTFDEEVAKCDLADTLLPTYQDGIPVSKESFETVFEDKADEHSLGDVVFYNLEDGIYIVQFVELTEEDSGLSRIPTEDEIKTQIDNSVSESYSELVSGYVEWVTIDEDVLEGYKLPWKV